MKIMGSSKLFLFFFFVSFYSSSSSSFNATNRFSAQQTLSLLRFKQNLSSINFSIDDPLSDSPCQNWLGSGYYPIMMSWNTSTDCCNWDGVTCDHITGDVIGLDLSCGMLQGTIHPNTTLFHLPRLQRLNLAFNDFSSSILPREIGRLSNSLTHLNISDCGFTGEFFSEFWFLLKLVSLDLSRNGFGFHIQPYVLNNILQNSTRLRELVISEVNVSSVLPTYLNLSFSIRSLDLSSTGLQGKLPINIFNLPYLEKVQLSDNDLTGPFPNSITNQSRLKLLDLRFNSLQGKLPDNIFNLRYLEKIDLSYNFDIAGPLPKVNKSAIKWLDLSYTNLSGELLNSIGHLQSLSYLDLSSCSLMGSFPKSLINLRQLINLDLSYNMLHGTLPSLLFSLPSLEIIYLDNNMFSGGLPSEFFNSRSLKKISLPNNQFDSEINQGFTPPSLINLTYLDLSWNNFSGFWDLDTLLSSLPNLEELVLSYSGLSVMTSNATYYNNPHFRKLGLASCKLTLFPESLRAMKNLSYLDLSGNDIRGRIPDWVGEIGGNELSYLDFSRNSLTGLPQFQWDKLKFLYLQSNMIQGAFPPSICNMINLYSLDLSNNSFGGSIPQCFGNISSSLLVLNLGMNRFHGTFPNVYNDCGGPEGIILNGNQLEGEVPSSLSKCKSLIVLDFGNNHLNGTFPVWLGGLPSLQVLVLKSNNFHGPIEIYAELKHPFPSLQVLDISHNRFVGHLPRQYFQNFNAMKDVVIMGPKLPYLNIGGVYYSIIVGVKGNQLSFPKFSVDYIIVDLSSNRFEGEVPDIIGSLNSLIALNLSHNNLNGQIPHALGNLSKIESLDLSWNELIGNIPQSMADITSLAVVNFSQNHLVGNIPEGKQFNTFDENSFGGNSGLCGFPLPKKCEHPSSPQVEGDGDQDEDEDEESEYTWKAVMLGYGCGTLLGLLMGYLMFSTGRPKWFNEIYDALEHMILKRRNKRR